MMMMIIIKTIYIINTIFEISIENRADALGCMIVGMSMADI